ncbi:MAG TPA: hypothetical protein VF040_11590 [Ktedonobacterales bacterium]
MGTRGMRDDARGGGAGAWDRPSRGGGGSRYPRRDVEDDRQDGGRAGGGGGSYGSRGRGDWDDPRGSRGGPPDRSMRGRRPAARDDWDAPSRGRGGPGGPAGSSGSSRRPQPGGGLWGDDGRGPRGRPGMRDPRAPRGGRGAAPEPEQGQLNFGKSVGIIGGMFLLGVAVAFVFFMVTRPTPQLDNTPTIPTSTTAPDLTPTTAPNVTPSPTGRLPGASPAYAFVFAGSV